MAAGCATEAFQFHLCRHIEDCEGWWLSSCHSSVAEHWLHKPGVLGSIPGNCWPFHFLYFRLKISKFSLFQREARVLRGIVDVRKMLKECEGGSWLKQWLEYEYNTGTQRLPVP